MKLSTHLFGIAGGSKRRPLGSTTNRTETEGKANRSGESENRESGDSRQEPQNFLDALKI